MRTGFLFPIQSSTSWFEWGLGLGAETGFAWKGTPLRFSAAAEFETVRLQAKAGGLLLAAALPRVELQTPVMSGFSLAAGGGAGWYGATLNSLQQITHNPYLSGALALRLHLDPALTFRLAGQYQNAWNLYEAVGVWLGFEIDGGGP